MIEQFARVLKVILAHLSGKEYDAAELLIEQTYRQTLGLNSDLIRSLKWSAIMRLQGSDPETYLFRCRILYRLLHIEATSFQSRSMWTEAFERLSKAQNICLSLILDNQILSDRARDEEDLFASAEIFQQIQELRSKARTAGVKLEYAADSVKLMESFRNLYPDVYPDAAGRLGSITDSSSSR